MNAPGYDLPLFVPATRPDRFEKALSHSPDAVIIDLEDAVAQNDKSAARDALSGLADQINTAGKPVFVRVNACRTEWFADDISLCADLPLSGVILPQSESADELAALRGQLAPGALCLALIETAAGLAAARNIAASADRLVFGSVDYCTDLGCEHERAILLPSRLELVMASRLADKPAPIDGVTTDVSDEMLVLDDARHAVALGFGGKLLIHPAQIASARKGFAPTGDQVAWAQKVLASSAGEAVALDGVMIDAPVLARARAVVARAQLQKDA